jgi:WD40-like Beta Propeller Repeat
VASLGDKPSATSIVVSGVDSGGAYVQPPSGRGPGILLYLKRRDLVAQRFDPASGRSTGEGWVLARRVQMISDTGLGSFSVGLTGTLVFAAEEERITQPRWVRRDGALLAAVGEPGEYQGARLSPDDRRLAMVRRERDFERTVWILDLERNVESRVSLAGEAEDPVWSPDGSKMAITWLRGGEEQANVYEWTPSSGADPRSLIPGRAVRWALDWSPDGRFILYAEVDPLTKFDVWAMPLLEGAKAIPVVRTQGKDNEGRFSPDGKLVAYQSDEAKQTRVYIRSFPSGPGPIAVSEGHGAEPRWRGDGRELYYISGDGGLMAVPFTADASGVHAGKAVHLFGGAKSNVRIHHFEPAKDGTKFLVLPASEGGGGPPVHLLMGWQSDLR